MRQVVLFVPGEPVTCAEGHELPASLEGSCVRTCPACGAQLWVLRHGDGAHTVVAVDALDVGILSRGTLSLGEVRDYLGLGRVRRGG